MSQNNVTKLVQPGSFSDPLTDVLRDGARTLLAGAVEAEVAAFRLESLRQTVEETFGARTPRS